MARNARTAPPAAAIEQISDPISDLAALPPRVRALRDKILAAAQSGDIANLRAPIEWNETPPVFGRGAQHPHTFDEIIEALKARSFDGKGNEILAILRAIFEQPYARVTRGPVTLYVWPAFAVKQTPDISDDTRLAMWRCTRFANLGTHNDIGLPLIERVGIGADGTWHYFYSG
jgi:hypothetical protein